MLKQDEIIEMAKQSGFSELEFFGTKVGTNVRICLEAFAKLVAAKERADEREACAKVCDERDDDYGTFTAGECALAIRARGEATLRGTEA